MHETIMCEAVMDRFVSECAVIYHLAAALGVALIVSNPVEVIERCVLGTNVVLRTAHRYRKDLITRTILGATILFAIGTTLHASTLTINPNPLYSGTQAIGTSTSLNVTLINGTRSTVKIMSVSSSLAQFSYSGPPLPVTLQSGQSMSGTVTFTPTASQTFISTLTFTRAKGSTISASLNGVGAAPPSIATQPVSQTVTAGQTATLSVTATGTAPLRASVM